MLEVKKENRFLIFNNTEKNKKLTFCLKDSQFYNEKEKPIKISTAKTFFKSVDYKDLPTTDNVSKIALLLKFFKLASKNTHNIGTLVEKYCEFEYLESWLFDNNLLVYINMLKANTSNHYYSGRKIEIPYNKVNKDIKIFMKKVSAKFFEEYDLNSSLNIIFDVAKRGYTVDDYRSGAINGKISMDEIRSIQTSLSTSRVFQDRYMADIIVELLSMQNTRYVNDIGMQQKAIKGYIDFCNKVLALQEKHSYRSLSAILTRYYDTMEIIFQLVDKFNHDITRTFAYVYDLLESTVNEFGIDCEWRFSRKLGHYRDYLEMRTRIYVVANVKNGKELTQESINTMLKSGRYVKYSEIEEQHDLSVKVLNNLEVKYNDVLFDLRKDSSLNDFDIEDYEFRVPKEPNELAVEGAVLGNCVKSYIEKVMKGETQIVLLRKKVDLDTPNVVFEVRGNAIVQLEGKSRRKANMFESKAIREYINKHNLICRVELIKWKTPKKEEKQETLKEN